MSGEIGSRRFFLRFFCWHMMTAAGDCPRQTRLQLQEHFSEDPGKGWCLGRSPTRSVRILLRIFFLPYPHMGSLSFSRISLPTPLKNFQKNIRSNICRHLRSHMQPRWKRSGKCTDVWKQLECFINVLNNTIHGYGYERLLDNCCFPLVPQ